MERWKKPPPPPPPPRPRRGYSCDHPSFSSTLLDAIYRSIDEPEGGTAAAAAAAAAKHPPPADAWRGATVRERDAAPRRTQPQTQPPPPPQQKQQQQQRRRGAYSTSSSSECSSYGGFSSSEPESGPGSARLKPIRTGSRPDPLHHHHHPAAIQSPGLAQPLPAEKKKPSSIRSRIREFRRSSKAPASPGARLASFLNSIFAAAAGNPRKPSKRPAATDISASCGESASACSTASSYSRSCLTKTPSSRGGLPPAPAPPPPPPPPLTAAAKRSVRFGPVSVIVDEERRRPCEKKLPYGGDPPPTARKRAEAMALGFGGEEEEGDEEDEEDEGESDASSDLFELESLAVAGDELPVYETTSFLTNRAIAHGLIV